MMRVYWELYEPEYVWYIADIYKYKQYDQRPNINNVNENSIHIHGVDYYSVNL